MADYAGAVKAIQDKFAAEWLVGGAPRTPVSYPNTDPEAPAWPPIGGDGKPVPFVHFEVIGSPSSLRGAGKPGDQVWLYPGHIFAHVFIPQGYGLADAQQLAVAAGEIFRSKTFYNDTPGHKVLGGSPWTDGGESDADNGNYFRLTCTIPFEYFHRG